MFSAEAPALCRDHWNAGKMTLRGYSDQSNELLLADFAPQSPGGGWCPEIRKFAVNDPHCRCLCEDH